VTRSFDVAEPTRDPRVFILLITLVPMAFILIVLFAFVRPAPPLFIVPFLLVTLIVPSVVILRVIKRREVVLDGATLQVQAGMSRQIIAVSDIDFSNARVLRLEEHPEWKPFLRTNGVGLPGLALGWFRTRNLTALFCLLTDRRHVLLLPLKEKNKALLLSLKRPDDLLSALRDADDARRPAR
jgi:hypothetical protein